MYSKQIIHAGVSSMKTDQPSQTVDQKKRVGRPKKTEIEKNKKGNRGKVGRPKGDAAKMNEYKAMMLTSPKSREVLTKIMDAALDDDHKNQSAAWKIITDRILPTGMFEKDAKSGKGGIQINVSVVGDASIDSKEIIDGDFEEIDNE